MPSPKPYTPNYKSLTNLSLQNVGWAKPGDPRFSSKFQYLANVVCAVGDAFYVRNSRKEWEEVKVKGHAVARVYQEHGGSVFIDGVQQIVGHDDIKAFMATGIQSFRALTHAPGAHDFVLFNGERRLNTWVDRRLSGSDDDIEHLEEFLRIIRNSLCDAPDELSLEEMLSEIMSDAPTPFRWVLHWLACRYQRPGYTTQTNLWFCGRRGTGKGSLISVMRQILGSRSVSKIDKADIQRGWTDSMFGADLIEWDEFKGAGWHDFSNLIKEKTGNESYIVTSRNVGSILQPAVAFHIFSTNERLPIFVERDDRQNSFIATTEDLNWSDRAKALWDPEDNTIDPQIVSGFAALLNAIEVDLAFIRKPIITALRTRLADHFADTTLTDWLDYHVNSPVRSDRPSWEELHHSYRDYVNVHCAGQRAMTLKDFKLTMVDEGHASVTVGKRLDPTSRTRVSQRYVRLTADTVVKLEDAEVGRRA